MTTRRLTTIALVVLLGWLAVGSGSTAMGATATDAFNTNTNSYGDSFAQGTISTVVGSETDTTTLPAGISADWWATARENLRQVEYNITWQEQTYLSDLPAPSAWLRAGPSTALGTGAYQAPNRAHNLRAYFTPTGVRVIPRADTTPGWEWGLSLIRYGYAGDLQPVAFAELIAEGNRIEYRRGDLTEWYVNDERGLEQGFTLSAPLGGQPQGSPLQIELALNGDLTPALAGDGSAIDFTTAGGVRVLRYADLHAYEATGRALPAHMSLVPLNNASCFTSHALRLTVDDTNALYPITIDPLATSPNWTAESDQAGALYGVMVSTAGDVNGDGYDEVIVGAMRYDNGQVDEGRVFAYYGSALGPSPMPGWMAESDRAYATFGISGDTAGDVNGDGYADVVVGAHGSAQAFVFHGSATGLPDADGDGLAHPGDADWTAQSDQLGSWFGYESSTAGDVNGDGYDEVIVAASLYTNGQSEEGRAFLYYGSASGLSPTADWMVESDLVGAHTMANGTAGDVNGDGYDDIIVGAHYNRADRAFVFYGSGAGLPDADADGLAHPSDANWTVRSDQSNSRFGTSVGTAGDVNGDGYADVIIGDNFYIHGQMAEGRAFVYYGSAIGLPDADGDGVAYPSDANWMAESDQAIAYFARNVATAGDVNGDGYDEVIIGAPEYDGGQSNEGAAFLFYGSGAGLPDADGDGLAHLSDATWSFESDQAGACLAAVGTPGDVNGDGLADVIIGAFRYDGGQADEGAAFVFLTKTPAAATQELIDTVVKLNLQQGIENSLDAKLDTVLQALDDLNEHNDVAAVNSLQAFINAVEAQRGKALTDTQADQLTEIAQAIISSLSE